MITTINTPEELTTHIEKLLLIEPRFLPIYTRVGVPTLRRQRGGFSQLMRAIVGQQLSTASANSIWERLEKSELTARPTPKQLKSLTSHWSPHRSAASLLLWEHYGWLKSRLDN